MLILEGSAARREAAPFPNPSIVRTTVRTTCGRLLQDLYFGALLEALDRGGFVVLHVEHGVELGDLKQVMHLLGEIE